MIGTAILFFSPVLVLLLESTIFPSSYLIGIPLCLPVLILLLHRFPPQQLIWSAAMTGLALDILSLSYFGTHTVILCAVIFITDVLVLKLGTRKDIYVGIQIGMLSFFSWGLLYYGAQSYFELPYSINSMHSIFGLLIMVAVSQVTVHLWPDRFDEIRNYYA